MNPPNFVTGSFSFYNADRDPTASEPYINIGYFASSLILLWKNSTTGVLWLLKDAFDNDDGTYNLTWVQFTVE